MPFGRAKAHFPPQPWISHPDGTQFHNPTRVGPEPQGRSGSCFITQHTARVFTFPVVATPESRRPEQNRPCSSGMVCAGGIDL